MGVPAFFRWLSRKYPSIVAHCVEEKPRELDGVKIPVDSSQPNPNNVEFDNLYLDMNGIIHPCCHPEDKPAPKNEDEMMVLIFEYIDRLFSIVRPRRLLYMAIDGVAPRAKMNQQRSRRFRASKEVAEKATEISEIRRKLQSQGVELPPEKPKGEHFDSNCITPGTPFMDRLAKCLHYYVHERLNTDPGWKNVTVILSDANVPGEGEHKIMDFIRKQRGNPDHDPNTHHCLCGADADLIMLGLATHEPNFTIIREEFKPNQPRPCDICGQIGHEAKECAGGARDKRGENDELPETFSSEQEFIFLRISVLREYLEKELNITSLPFPFDLERAIDDWVFMCFFVGNDFLPHLPSLEIREGAIDKLVGLYKQLVTKTRDYLTDSGMVSMDKVQVILAGLGEVEDEVFKRRQEREVFFKRRDKEKKRRAKMSRGPAFQLTGQFAPVPIGSSPGAVRGARHEAYVIRTQPGFDNRRAAADLKASLVSPDEKNKKRTASEAGLDDSDSEEEVVDEVRLWEAGWKERYYESKFEVDKNDFAFRHKVACEYSLGLCWVLQYYYQGCPSWKWFFPYHYAPFASDFVNIASVSTVFERGTSPFNPLEQLMGVFPAASQRHLPKPWGELMSDAGSPIIDFYPEDFTVDLNGKKFAWQGVALLPFVDEKRLLAAVERVYPLLTEDERRRNTRGIDKLFVGRCHPAYRFLSSLYEGDRNADLNFGLDTSLTYGVGGSVRLSGDVVEPGGVVSSPVPGCEDFHDNRVICVGYADPSYADGHVFPARRLTGAKEPLRTLKPSDLTHQQSRNWRPVLGMAPATQRASVDVAGMRMLRHGLQSQGYNAAPPPSDYAAAGGQRGRFRSEPYSPGDSRQHQHRYYNDRQRASSTGYQPPPFRGNRPRWPAPHQHQHQHQHQQRFFQDGPQRFPQPPPPPRSDYRDRQPRHHRF